MVTTDAIALDRPDERHRTEAALRWVGRIVTGPPVMMLVLSSLLKLTDLPGHVQLAKNWGDKFGYPARLLVPIGLLELACVCVYLVPRTAALGCILVSGFLAAAFATHLRIGDLNGGAFPLVLAVLAWVGLFLRDDQFRSLLPLCGKSKGR
jgi:hypothetical protein